MTAAKRRAKVRGRRSGAAKSATLATCGFIILPCRAFGTAQRAARASQAPSDLPCAANIRHRSKPHRTRRILTYAGPSLPGREGKFPIPAKRIFKSRIRFPFCVRLRRATSAATKLDGQRSGADHRTGGKSRTRAFANPSLPSPAGTAQRAVRASQAWPCEVPPRKARAGRPSEAPRRKA